MEPPPIQIGFKNNWYTLLRAIKDGNAGLCSAIRKSDQKPVVLICAFQRNEDNTITPVPFAEMVSENPFELYEDPTT